MTEIKQNLKYAKCEAIMYNAIQSATSKISVY